MSLYKAYFDFSLNLREANTASYRKMLQIIYKTIKQIDNSAMIIQYKDNKEEAIIEKNTSGVAVKAKHTLLNYMEAIPQFL